MNDTSASPLKRAKTTSTEETSLFSRGLLSSSTEARLTKTYASSGPFPHVVFDPLCDVKTLREVREEIKTNVKCNYKETDLFKLYQTTDLANVDATLPELAAKLPRLLALRDALYSSQFREYVQRVTGCCELTTRVDMAASAYAEGCHLLCHDDVIGTRAVSFVLYLTEEDWTEKDGGALELYDVVSVESDGKADVSSKRDETTGTPGLRPTKSILPLFNTMVVFGVSPGRSYHAVQEVFTDRSPRISIQGWYHGKEPPKGVDKASLAQLKSAERSTTLTTLDLVPGPLRVRPTDDVSPWALSTDDIKRLRPWINDVYLQRESVKRIRAEFEDNAVVSLGEFFKSTVTSSIVKSCEAADASSKTTADEEGGWTTVGPVNVQRYQRLNEGSVSPASSSPLTAAGRSLASMRSMFSRDEAFGRLIQELTGETFRGVRSEVRRFRPGSDYTVAHHGLLESENRLDAVWTIMPSRDSVAWGSGEIGGFECYIAAEDEALEAAEVYAAEGAEENELLNVVPDHNTLSLVLRDVGTMRFVKYVSRRAPCSRWDVSTVYTLEASDSP